MELAALECMVQNQQRISERSKIARARERRRRLGEEIASETNEERKRALQSELEDLENTYSRGELDEIQAP